MKEKKNQSNKEVKRLDDELLRLEKQQEEENKKHGEEMQRLQKDLTDMKKQAVVNAVKEHENSIYGDLRNNYMECISQGAKTVDNVLPFGGKIVGGTIGATLGFLGGVGSWLAYLLRGK